MLMFVATWNSFKTLLRYRYGLGCLALGSSYKLLSG